MARQTFKIEGLRALEQALAELPEATGKNVLRRVGRSALQPMDEAWRERAPKLSGKLARSGSVGSKLTRGQRKAHERDSFVEVFSGPGADPEAVQQEFGNIHHPPQPFMRPAWEETKDQALQIVRDQLGDEILKAAQRRARKAARAAKKG